MEQIDVYDENLKLLGVMDRAEAHRVGAWHRSIHCWVVRPKDNGYVLFQKRGSQKKLFPNFLDITAAGHLSAGERPEDGVREILEELGLSVKFSDLKSLGIKFDVAKIGDVTNREFCDVYFLERHEAPDDYKLDSSEVEGLVEIQIDDGLRLFSGEIKSAPARGIEWIPSAARWQSISLQVGCDQIIPRIDPYYRKIFILAKLYLAGEKHLSI